MASKEQREYEDPHLGCPGYPECDEEMSEACCVENEDSDVEWYGHRDSGGKDEE